MHERWEELLKELLGDLLYGLLVDALLQEAALQDVTPPSLHVGGDALTEADLVSGFGQLAVENVNDVEAVRGDQVDLGVAQFIADVHIVLQVH